MHSGARSVNLAWSAGEVAKGKDLLNLDDMVFLLNPVPRIGEEVLLLLHGPTPRCLEGEDYTLHLRVVDVLHHVTPVQKDKMLFEQREPMHHVDVFVERA